MDTLQTTAPAVNACMDAAAAPPKKGGDAAFPSFTGTPGLNCDTISSGFSSPEIVRKIVPCRCRSAFCRDCAWVLGVQYRDRLLKAVESWSGLLMVTFTVDPKNFASYEDGFDWITDNRCISRTFRQLRRIGHDFGHYFGVLECQQSGNPHWHFVVDTNFLKHADIYDYWITLGPPGCSRLGGVHVSGNKWRGRREIKSREHAVNYATKYLMTVPKHDWPAWIFGRSHIQRFVHSRGMFSAKKREEPEPTGKKRKPARVLSDRLGDCGQKSIAITEIAGRRHVDKIIDLPYEEIRAALDGGRRSTVVNASEVSDFSWQAKLK